MSWNSVMGFIASVALFLPIFFILLYRLGGYRTFPALLCYYVIVFAYNLLTEGYISSNKYTIYYWNICNNLLDAPLVLLFLTYFCPSPGFAKNMRIGICALVAFEIIIVLLKGFTVSAITIIMGPGLLTVLFFSVYFFIRQTKITIKHQKGTGKAMIAASLLFAYGCYTIIYLMYYVFKTPYIADTFLVYFLVATFSSVLMCAGIAIERKRVKKLNELIQTRKELSDIYKDSPSTGTLRTAVLDFDKDPWNQ